MSEAKRGTRASSSNACRSVDASNACVVSVSPSKRVAHCGLVLVLALALIACTGSTTPTGTTTARRTTPRLQVRALDVEHVRIPSDGLVHLALWIDGGSFDADPPATATLAAWAVESEGLTTRATPDGIELSLRGTTDALDASLAKLARALATRTLPDARHRELSARLEDARRRALASPARRADELALRALLGPAVSPFEGDPSRADVERVFSSTFGPERALLVVIGEVDEARLQRAIEAAFERAPAASGGSRGEIAPEAIGEIERGPVSALSVAATTASVDEAWALARALAPEAQGAWVYPHRGGASVIVRAEPATLPSIAAQLRFASATPRTPPEAVEVATLAERRGLAWLAERHDEPAGVTRRVSVGAVCAEERGESCVAAVTRARAIAALDDVSADPTNRRGQPPTNSTNRRGQPPMNSTNRRGQPPMNPNDEPAAEARAENGARVRVETREGPLALTLRFETDGTDAAAATVLANVLAARCASEASLEQVTPELEPQGISLVARAADPTRASESIAALVRCASTSNLREVDRVRLRALETRRRSPERGWLAHALTPGALATVAPRGDARGLSRTIDPRAFASATRVGARTTLALVGPVEAGSSAELGARLLSFLPSGEAVTRARWGEAVPLVAERFEAPRVRLALGWRADDASSRGAAVVARAFADAVAARLGAEAEPRWRDGGEGPSGGAWAAVAIDVAPEQVDAVIERARAVRGPSTEELARAFERERWAGADARVAALRLARTGSTRATLPSAAEAEAIVRALRSGAFVIAVGRTQQARAWQRR
jgi:hypothetical protein